MIQITTHYRVAVIGAGSIAKYSHVPGFKRLANCEVVALCDVNETRARELAAETGVLGVYSDAERMLLVMLWAMYSITSPGNSMPSLYILFFKMATRVW